MIRKENEKMKTARKDWKGTKKLLLWITAAAMTLCLGACSDQAADGKESKESASVEASSENVNKSEPESKAESKEESKEEGKQLDWLSPPTEDAGPEEDQDAL